MFYIVVPVFNEENTVRQVIEELTSKYSETKIIVVDDGSTDGTVNILENLSKDNLVTLNLVKNSGKGAAMKMGLLKVLELDDRKKDSVIIFFDSDLEIDSSEIKGIIEYYKKNKEALAVFGSRFLKKNNFKDFGYKYIINFLLTFLSNLITRNKLTDMETALKSFKVELIEKLKLSSNGFDIEPEIVFNLSMLNIDIVEIPINYNPRSKKDGKKMSINGGIETLKALLKFAIK
tara:strand:+ start:179 stop:877 length:699 start_codon:yes stop_codon:yes gene_type:complete